MDLIDKVFTFLNRFNKPVSTHSFGLFRILFSAHILLIISQVYTYRQLIFEAVPGVSKNVFPALLYIFIWTIAVLFLITGTKTKWAALVNYICVVLATSIFTNSNVGTFNDDLLRIGSFLCIFMPVSRSFSFDSLINKLTFHNPKPAQTSYLFYLIFIFLSLGLLYFPSGDRKSTRLNSSH